MRESITSNPLVRSPYEWEAFDQVQKLKDKVQRRLLLSSLSRGKTAGGGQGMYVFICATCVCVRVVCVCVCVYVYVYV